MNAHLVRTLTASCVAFCCSGALASSPIVDIAWSADGRFAHQATIAAGKFVELCGKLQVRDAVRWSFTAAAPVDFNIHYHVGKDVVYPIRQTQMSASRATLNVESAQDYCWMWTNKGTTPIGLTVELAR